MNVMHSTVVAMLVATGLFAGTATAYAQDYPTKPLRILVPFTPGSATDVIARIVVPKMAERWGRSVVIDNRPSAGGIVACTAVAESTPDGHTLMVTGANFAGSAALYAGRLPYDPVKDFAGVTQFATTPLVLVVGSSLGVKSVKELIALAHEQKGQLNFASAGIGSGTHYGAELFKLAAGIGAVHVPYRGSPETLTDVMAGRVHFVLSPVLAATPIIRSGRVLALGVTTAQRAPALPDVPTIAEAGVPGFEYQGWYGMFAPGKTPRKIISTLHAEAGRVLELAETREKIVSLGAAVKSGTSAEFDRIFREEITTRMKVWTAAGVKAE